MRSDGEDGECTFNRSVGHKDVQTRPLFTWTGRIPARIMKAMRAVRSTITIAVITAVLIAAGTHAGDRGGVVSYTFPDVSAARGIGHYEQIYNNGGGIAAADFDDDGDIDMYIPCAPGFPNQLYENQGDGSYVNIAQQLGVDLLDGSRAALWFDYDGDGRLDLVVGHDHSAEFDEPQPANTLHLFRQRDDQTFEDVTATAGLAGNFHEWFPSTSIGGFAVGDINNDGWLDLVMTQWFGHTYLFLNNGDGTFADISDSAGLRPYVKRSSPGARGVPGLITGFQPVMHDFNGDGWQDIFIAVDFEPNYLWINQGNTTFVDVAPAAGCAHRFNCMGVAPGDYDRDGDIDLYVTNIYEEEDGEQKHNVLYRNDTTNGNVQFAEVSQDLGVDDGAWGWGATFLDADNDGALELAEVNGYRFPMWQVHPTRFYTSLKSPAVDVAAAIGLDEQDYSSGLVAFDSDRDGDLDLVRTSIDGDHHFLRLNECEHVGKQKRARGGGSNNHWLVVRPRMEGSNVRAIGAVVHVTINGVTTASVITAGTSYLCQQPAEAHFGLGANATADVVTIDWPGGGRTVQVNVLGDQVRTVTRWQCSGDVNQSEVVDVFDLLELLTQWGQPANPRADVNSSGVVDGDDIHELLANWGECK